MSAGGSYSQSKQRSRSNLTPQQFVDMYKDQLPSILQAISGTAAPTAKAQAGAGVDVLKDYGQQSADIGNQLMQGQAGATNQLLQGAGGDAARSAVALNTDLNPSQAIANKGTLDLINSYNLKGLSPGEQNAVERGLNQVNTGAGNLGLQNATNAVSNAMMFGDRFRQKQLDFGNALGVANQTAANQNAQVNPVGTALGAGNTATNFGLANLNPQANTQTAFNFGQGFGSQLAGIGSVQNSKARSMSASADAGCCFIMMEAYHGQMPLHVRRCRDKYYHAFPSIAAGYVRMAKYLVPAMKKSRFIRSMVWTFMVNPLTQYGKFVTRQDRSKYIYKPARKFWFTLWNIIGKL